ncbi:MAG: glycosyltransferase family 2 protein [Lentisphaerae bacterium]|nr:glycosyltransferase family 2 protein [Lentisphaerota bacterium]
MDLSIVVPVYNEVENVEILCDRIHESLSVIGRSYEVLLVDDGSSDGTWDKLVALSKKYPNLHLIHFRGNFGQTAAMSAGIRESNGDIIVTMDADLQNDPSDIPLLLECINRGADVASGWRKDRKDKFLSRRLPSIIANKLISKITGITLHDYGCTLKAYRREVIKDVHLYGEMHRFIPALASWVGATVDEVIVKHYPRIAGESKYGISRTLRVVLDLLTVKFLLRYSRGPIQIFGKIGMIFGFPGLLLLLGMILAHLSHLLLGTEFAAGLVKRPFWIMSSFMLIFFGVQFVCMGLLAEIQIRTWYESQDKATYVIKETVKSSRASN